MTTGQRPNWRPPTRPAPPCRRYLTEAHHGHAKRCRRMPQSRHRLRQSAVNCCDKSVCYKHENVVNLSSYHLTDRESDILSRGLSFIPYNPHTNRVTENEITDFVKKLRFRYKYRNILPNDNPFRLKSKQTPIPTDYKPLEDLIDKITLTISQIKPTTGRPNLPSDGMSLIHRLKNEHDVIIKQADKPSYYWTETHMWRKHTNI